MKVQTTTDYEQFDRIAGNRDITTDTAQRQVGRLITQYKLAQERNINLFEVMPLVINERKEIIDGQHRLEAAKRLGVPVYYRILPGLRLADVIALNTTQKPWTTKDYVNLWIDEDNEHYQALQEFVDKYNLPYSSAVPLLVLRAANIGKPFQQGKFVVDNYEYAEELVGYMDALKPHMRTPLIYRDAAFAKAVRRSHEVLERDFETSFQMIIEAYAESTEFINFDKKVFEYMRSFEQVLKKNKRASKLRLF